MLDRYFTITIDGEKYGTFPTRAEAVVYGLIKARPFIVWEAVGGVYRIDGGVTAKQLIDWVEAEEADE